MRAVAIFRAPLKMGDHRVAQIFRIARAFNPKPQRIARSLCGRQAELAVHLLIESVSCLRTLSDNNFVDLGNRDHFVSFAEHALQIGHRASSGDELKPPRPHFDNLHAISRTQVQCEPHFRRNSDSPV